MSGGNRPYTAPIAGPVARFDEAISQEIDAAQNLIDVARKKSGTSAECSTRSTTAIDQYFAAKDDDLGDPYAKDDLSELAADRIDELGLG